MSPLSPEFKERVMARIRTHEEMAALYSRAVKEGFDVRRDPDRRGILIAGPADLAVGGRSMEKDPRFGTLADLLESEGAMFDFLESSDRLAAAVFSEGSAGPAPSAAVAVAPPLVLGGQGRDREELVAETKAVLLVGGLLLLAALAVGLGAGLLP